MSILSTSQSETKKKRSIGNKLVESCLAACVNIFDNMNSFYWWEGQLQNDQEVALIAKLTLFR